MVIHLSKSEVATKLNLLVLEVKKDRKVNCIFYYYNIGVLKKLLIIKPIDVLTELIVYLTSCFNLSNV